MNLLITGGSGYLGHGIVGQLLGTDANHRICVYSRDEAKHAAMRAKFNDDQRLRFFIGDVRDVDRLAVAMRGVEYVIHAAALKRIETLEYNVIEGVATNIMGSQHVVTAAIASGVRRAVLVSTDKACEPTTVYGRTKAIAEDIFRTAHAYAGNTGTTFRAVRYGNVAGSTGSVIPIWRTAMAEGKPCELRDPEATRFWMTRTEAVEFVLRALHRVEETVLVPILPAYRLGDLAAAMGVHYVRITQLAEGEKQHESMLPRQSSDQARRMKVKELREALTRL